MLQHFIFWRSRKVQQDSVFDHVPSEMCRAATAAHPTATVQGCRNCHVWGMLQASWGEKPCTAAPHRVRWALLKGCRWDRGYNKRSRQWGSWECQGALASLESPDLWVSDHLGFSAGEMWWSRCSWWQAEEGKSLWQWVVFFGSEFWCWQGWLHRLQQLWQSPGNGRNPCASISRMLGTGLLLVD